MKIDIEIVTGFLGSGKTSFINALLSEGRVQEEKILVIQLEQGRSNLVGLDHLHHPFKYVSMKKIDELEEKLIGLIVEYKPNRIVVEYNGTFDLKEIIGILNKAEYKRCSRISTIFFVTDGNKVAESINNIGSFIVPFIKHADMIVVNNIDKCSNEIIKDDIKRLKNINPKAYILKVNNKYFLNSELRKAKVLDNGYLKKIKVRIMNHHKEF